MNRILEFLIKRWATEKLLKFVRDELPKRLLKPGRRLSGEEKLLALEIVGLILGALYRKGFITTEQRDKVATALGLII